MSFGAGEVITTLVAYKYTLAWFSTVASSARWNIERVFTDADHTTRSLVACLACGRDVDASPADTPSVP